MGHWIRWFVVRLAVCCSARARALFGVPHGARTPPDKEFSLGGIVTYCFTKKNLGGLRLVDISRTPIGVFLINVHLISEMVHGNGWQKLSNRGVLWRFFVTISAQGRPGIVLPRHSFQALPRPVASRVARFDGVFGADWPTWAPGAACACLARVDRRVTGEQVCLRTHHTMVCGNAGGRVMDCAGSSVAAEWPDPEGDDGAPIPVRRLRLNPRSWVAVATANGQARAEWATRGDKRRNTAAHGHGISQSAFRTALMLGVDEAGSVSWRSRARRLDDGPSALTGPVAEAPEVNFRRSARSDHETELAARSPGGADTNPSFFCKTKFPQKKLLQKKTFLVRGCARAQSINNNSGQTVATAYVILHRTLHRAPVGQGPSGPDWLTNALGFWSGRALATGDVGRVQITGVLETSVVAGVPRYFLVRGCWAVEKLATGQSRGGQGHLPLSSRAIGRQADPPYTTTAPGRGGGNTPQSTNSPQHFFRACARTLIRRAWKFIHSPAPLKGAPTREIAALGHNG